MKVITSIFGIMVFIGFIVHLLDEYAGIRVSTKYGGDSPSKVQRTIEQLFDYKKRKKSELVEFAIERVKNKKFAMTKSNVLTEIEKIKRDKSLMNLINSKKNSN